MAYLQAVYPMEGCGLLAGKDGRVEQHYPIDNVLNSPFAFELEPTQLIGAIMDLESKGLSLLAIYHSHPKGSTVPSLADIAQANYPDAVQIIISFENPEQPEGKGYLIVDGRVKRTEIRFLD